MLAAALAVAHGPDEGGYRWLDSDTTPGPVFDWIDITGSGTRIELGDDDNAGPLALGFGVGFYGQEYDSIRVCSNGWLSFTSSSHQFHHYPIPGTRDPNALLAPLWTDLDPSEGGAVYHLVDGPNARFVVSWVGVRFHGGGDSCTFQAVFDTSGTVLFQYLDVPDGFGPGVDSCSVGIENTDGTVGLEYLFDASPAANRLHDSLAIRFYRLEHDVCPKLIGRPFADELVGMSIVPTVSVFNYGRATESFDVTVRVDGYEDVQTLSGLGALEHALVRFEPWVVTADTFEMVVFTSLAGDQCPGNDTIRLRIRGSEAGELRCDDGMRDTWFLRVGSPTRDWGVAIRFDRPDRGFSLAAARLFVADTQPFARVLVCPGDSGEPDLENPYCEAESVRAAEPETWLDVPFDTLLGPEGDLWLVAFWPRSASGPAIGEDRTAPVDSASWFGSASIRWLPLASGDLMARLAVNLGTGIRELEPASLRRVGVYPNPFRGAVTIRLPGAWAGGVRVIVRDVAGRVVRTLGMLSVGHGASSVTWDGIGSDGCRVPAGAYYIEVHRGQNRWPGRVVRLR